MALESLAPAPRAASAAASGKMTGDFLAIEPVPLEDRFLLYSCRKYQHLSKTLMLQRCPAVDTGESKRPKLYIARLETGSIVRLETIL